MLTFIEMESKYYNGNNFFIFLIEVMPFSGSA